MPEWERIAWLSARHTPDGEAVSITRLRLDDRRQWGPDDDDAARRQRASTTTSGCLQDSSAERTYSAIRANTLTGIPVMAAWGSRTQAIHRQSRSRRGSDRAGNIGASWIHAIRLAPLLLCGSEPRGRYRTLEECAVLQSVARPPWSPLAPRCERGEFSRPGGKVRSLPSALSVSGTVVGESEIYRYLHSSASRFAHLVVA